MQQHFQIASSAMHLKLASSLAVGVLVSAGDRVFAQAITPDTTLGNEGSVITPINGTTDRINGGARRGSNLFHSFRAFSIPENFTVEFSNPTGIRNIFSRVTGNTRSEILGTLGVAGEANLFLINPNGILFGPNTSLDIRGSFTASTASSITLPDGTQFSARNPAPPPLLVVDVIVPVGLQFEGQPGIITNRGNLSAGQDLTLAAGNLDLQGQLQARRDLSLWATEPNSIKVTSAAGTQINFLASGAFSGKDPNGQAQTISASGVGVTISAASIFLGAIDTSTNSAANAGAINLTATQGDVYVTGDLNASSLVSSGNAGTVGNAGKGGAITITSSRKVTARQITTSSQIGSQPDNNSPPNNGNAGNGGKITITSGENISISGLSTLSRVRLGNGDTGNSGAILVKANGIADLGKIEALSSVTGNGNAGNGGEVSITGNTVTTKIIETTSGTERGNTKTAGNIQIDSLGNIKTGALQAFSQVGDQDKNIFVTNGKTENGGMIRLTSHAGNINVNGDISSLSRVNGNGSTGNAGTVVLISPLGSISTGPVNAFSNLIGSGTAGTGGSIALESYGDIMTAFLTSSSLVGQTPQFNFGVFRESNGNASKGGNINVTSHTGNINLDGAAAISVVTGTGSAEKGGDIQIKSSKGKITVKPNDGDAINTFSSVDRGGQVGNGGDVILEAMGDIATNNIRTFTQGNLGNVRSGNIDLSSQEGSISTGSLLAFGSQTGSISTGSLPTFGIANRGNITLNAYGDITTETRTNNEDLSRNRNFSVIDASGGGSGGNIFLSSQAGTIKNQVANFPETLNSSQSGFLISSNGVGNGSGGDIQLQASYLSFTNTDITTTAAGQGNPGKIVLKTPGSVQLNASRLFTSSERGTAGIANETSGRIEISAQSLLLNNFSFIDTATFSQKKAGDVDINVRDAISLFNGSAVFSITADKGKAGNVTLNAGGEIFLVNQSNISTAVNEGAMGNGGDIRITADSLTLERGSQLQTLTRGDGAAGNISVNTLQGVTITGTSSAQATSNANSQIRRVTSPESILASVIGDQLLNNFLRVITSQNDSSQVESDVEFANRVPYVSIERERNNSAVSDKYNFEIKSAGTRAIFDIDGSAEVDTIIRLFDNKGVEIARNNNADANSGTDGSLARDPSGRSRDSYLRYTFTEPGTYSIQVGQFVPDNVRIDKVLSSATYKLQVSLETPNVTARAVDGSTPSGLFAQTEGARTGQAGSISLGSDQQFIQKLTIKDGAKVVVDSQSPNPAGNITASANTIILDRGSITGVTRATDGGNITLNVRDLLLMRHGSQISTTAGTAQAGGNGGNITINARNGFIVAVPRENSDITANAFAGNGGRVQISAQRLFGIEPRARLTPLSDITATSELGIQGVVEVNTPGIDPTGGLQQLPEDPRSPQLSEGCQAGTGRGQSSFTNIGKGGLPPRPDEPLAPDLFAAEWNTSQSTSQAATPRAIAPNETINPIEPSHTASRLTLPCQSN